MYFFYRKRRKRNKGKRNSSFKDKKGVISREQMVSISSTIINKKRLVVYSENI